MVERITDLHMHIVPDIDDGSESVEMSLQMLRSAYEQGARSVFCTSHSWDNRSMRDRYLSQFEKLRKALAIEKPDMKLFTGAEILFDDENISDVLRLLNEGILLPLNGTRYVLTEFWPDERYAFAESCVKQLLAAGWQPVIAHAERCMLMSVEKLQRLCALGCLVQINAYSLEDEHDPAIREKAQTLLQKRLVSFIGSDAHTTYHRPPKYTNGVKYIWEHCEPDYAEAVLFRNAEKSLKS